MTPEFKRIKIAQEIVIEAPKSKVFRAILHDTKAWWGAPYLADDFCEDIQVEAKVGGRFYETWGPNQGRIWGVVTQIKNDHSLEITGPFCMTGTVHAVVAFDLEDHPTGTRLKFTHDACGYISEDSQRQYGLGWQDLLGIRLKAFVETGTRYGLGHEKPPIFSKKN